MNKKTSKYIFSFVLGLVLFFSSLLILPKSSSALESLVISDVKQTTAVATVSGIDPGGEYLIEVGIKEGNTLAFHYSKRIQIGEAIPTNILSWTMDSYPPDGFFPNTNYTVVLRRTNFPIKNIASTSFTTVKAVAVITSISPTSGKVGDTITINGENFSLINKVIIGGVDVGINFSPLSTTKITAPIPVGAKADKVIVETTNNGTATSTQTLSIIPTTTAGAPTITSFSVTSSGSGSTIGSTTGKPGDQVTIVGTNLVYISKILFNDAQAVTLTNTPTTVTVTIPTDASSGKIKIITQNGEVSSATDFTVVPYTGPVANEKISTTALTSNSVIIIFSCDVSKLLPQYKLDLVSTNQANSGSNQSKTLYESQISNAGLATVSFNQLIPSSGYIVRLSSGATLLSETTFTTLATGGSTPGTTKVKFNGLVPDCNSGAIDPKTNQYVNSCDFNTLMATINKVINFLLVDIVAPLFALILIYAGWLYLSDMGSSENKGKAKKILINSVVGFVIALVAWLIVKTILSALGFVGPTFLG